MFRTRKFNTCPPSPKEFSVPVLQEYYEADGTKCCHVVNVPSSSVGHDLPNIEDYQLSSLLAAGVPLNPVSSNVLDNAPSEAEANVFLDSLDKLTNTNDKD